MNDLQQRVLGDLMARVDAARSGSLRDAAIAASLIHRYREVAIGAGLNRLYDDLLIQVLGGSDPELLACAGEELFLGRHLAPNPKLGLRFLERSAQLNTCMGAYVMGRLFESLDSQRALEQFERASRAGHIPSAIMKHRLRARRMPLIGLPVGLWLGAVDFFATWRAVRVSPISRDRFWRYRDVFPEALDPVDAQIGADRLAVFGKQ